MADPIALAVPFFFVLMGVELVWAKKKGVRVYRFADAVTDLSCGITSQVALLVWAAAQLAIYALVYEHLRLVTITPAWLPWLIAFVGVDFLYYWWHRLSHEVNLLWAAHVVHHQSEDYNLAVALRQAVLTSWTALPFYLPLAIVGVPPLVFATVHALSILYQFWIHTELVGRIGGAVGKVLNLPHHHRVHHAINPAYLDKNYGATLIVWDRLFGTYADETEKPVYGITTPLGSFNAMWAQVHYWVELGAMTRAARGAEKLRVWFASPAWKPTGYVPPALAAGASGASGVPPVAGPPATRTKYDCAPSPALVRYVSASYVVVLVATFCMMMWHGAIATVPLVLGGAAVLASLVAFGALLERRSWARHADVARIALSVVALGAWLVS
jgi:alkylglycerol monooxygenase